MSLRRSSLRFSLRLTSPLRSSSRRFFATSQSPPNDAQSRLRRLNDRLPRFLRSYTTPLIGAPGTHITSFLILHELTAIVPLFGLVAAFHYGNWLPDLTSSTAFEEGTRRFGRWLRKKGWIEEEVDMATVTADGSTTEHTHGDREKQGVRPVLEFATAYAVTKALLPIRIAASVWATPWFARVVLSPLGRGVRRVFGRK
ncbi:hypothetical protein AFLA70_29g004690 [Aspergillus terreus]|uniref:Uncharacterized protein n=1 Tax=Aspergillus terreus TaxID=33178 RepID=A0A5M3ZEC4_ASPTE|nr:hypothetical protein ATETN484_0013011400 [Aspergillus terreus]GFF20348.1 hypothetical protein AFLA70_29g004690 [Aspergillus terreus]